jgi:malonyl CoA-acyl carrier protein transacylase
MTSSFSVFVVFTNAIFAFLLIHIHQVAATQILASVGVVPDYYMGHSLGETAAGHARGLQSEKETILIAYVRAKLSGGIKAGGAILKTPQDRSQEPNFPSQLCVSKGNFYYEFASPQAATAAAGPSDQVFDLNGQMVAVGLPAAEIQAAIVELNLKETCVACFNGPAGQTVSGAAVEVALLKAKLASVHGESLFWREVDTDGVAYHAPHLNCYFDYLTGEFERILGDGSASAGAKARPLDQGWCTTSTPMPAYNSEDFLTHQKPMLDAEFHARNIVSPVYFQQAIESLPPGTLVVEVGSSQSLLGQVKRVRADIGLTGLVKRLEPTTETLLVHPLLAKAALWEAGYSPATTVAAAASAAAASSAIKGKNDAPQPLVAYAGAELGDDPLIPAPIKKSHSFEKAKPPAVPPAPGAFPTALVELPRPPFEERWPAGLWEHDREQRVFTHLDFELKIPNEGGDDAEGMGGATAVAYDLAGADAFLMDHRVNGRALFPATGHLYTMWHAKGLAQGLKLRDFEVLTAVVLDPANAPTLTFGVAEMGNTLAVLYQGAVVARATFEVLGEATPENAACAPRPELELEGSSDTVEGRLWVPRGQLYNHFKRYVGGLMSCCCCCCCSRLVVVVFFQTVMRLFY